MRTALQGEGDLLSLLPDKAYHFDVGYLGYSRRAILLVNRPELIKGIMTDPLDIYPKNDLMVGALEPLVGDSIFVSSGDRWRGQRALVDPAFSHMRITRAFDSMVQGVDAYEEHLARVARDGEKISLDLAMSHLTADIICRTVFSTSLQSNIAREVFDAFTVFERSVAHVELKALIFDPPFKRYEQQPTVLQGVREDPRAPGRAGGQPPAGERRRVQRHRGSVRARRGPDGEPGLTRKELIDQLGVFFLAGHETTASVLTWVFFILAVQPQTVARIREEVQRVVGDGEVAFDHIRQLAFTRAVFRETLRLYPPITFIPRVAAEATKIDRFRLRRGAMVMISPWTIHRHRRLWREPDLFDPDRFMPEREKELPSGAYLPFGTGPRVCVGASFALTESTLILARLVRRFDFHCDDAKGVRPAARLTTRPTHQVYCTVSDRQPA